jgi:hypothetical protein
LAEINGLAEDGTGETRDTARWLLERAKKRDESGTLNRRCEDIEVDAEP